MAREGAVCADNLLGLAAMDSVSIEVAARTESWHFVGLGYSTVAEVAKVESDGGFEGAFCVDVNTESGFGGVADPLCTDDSVLSD